MGPSLLLGSFRRSTGLVTALRELPSGGAASTIGEAAGVSRVTVRRYLEHLVATEMVGRAPRYGSVGRPEMACTWIGER